MRRLPLVNIDQLKERIASAVANGGSNIAAFDADGTLWTNDMGEKLFSYQIENRLLPMLPKDPWKHYMDMQAVSKPEAYLWLAQINSGLPIEQVREWAREAVGPHEHIPIIPTQVELIHFLKSLGVDVYIVTASVAWAVEPAAEAYGIPAENVVGITTKIENGRVTTEQGGPITYREGKVEGLKARTKGKLPFFSSGNTEGDYFLLESATDTRLVVATATEGEHNYETERTMVKLAKERGWFVHDYVAEEFD